LAVFASREVVVTGTILADEATASFERALIVAEPMERPHYSGSTPDTAAAPQAATR